MGRILGSIGLLLLSLVMLWGFLRSDAALSAPATIAALLITVGLPAAAGVALGARHFGRRARLAGRREELRQQTLEAEILRLAQEHNGKIAVVEIVTDLAITPEEAEQALESMVARELADIEITESGVVVYAFHDIKHLNEKPQARGILDG